MTQNPSSVRDQQTTCLSSVLLPRTSGMDFEPSNISCLATLMPCPTPDLGETRDTSASAMSSIVSPSGLGLAVSALAKRLSCKTEADPTIEDTLASLLSFTDLVVAEGRAIAQRLLKHFGSLGSVLGASPRSLQNLLGECNEVIALLRGVHQAMVLTLREPLSDRTLIQNSTALKNYLHISLAHEEREIVRLLFLDTRNALILDEMHSQGTINQAPVYPREIVRRLIEVNATALIIVHNHPSGDPTPSVEDIDMTRLIASVLSGIGVKLQDSVVVGRGGYASFRSLGFL